MDKKTLITFLEEVAKKLEDNKLDRNDLKNLIKFSNNYLVLSSSPELTITCHTKIQNNLV